MELKTAQEVFDFVVTHLRTQGCQALDFDKGCVYRTPDGKKCAVGCLIPDKEYIKEMEGVPVSFFIGLNFIPNTLSSDTIELFKTHLDLLSDLQSVHDCLEAWIKINNRLSNLESQLEKVAIKHRLIYTPPKE